MEALVAAIQAKSDTAEHLRELHARLKQEENALSGSNQLHQALAAVQPTTQSLGYLYILNARACQNLQGPAKQEVLNLARGFFADCDASQIRMAPDKVASLCHQLADLAITRNNPRAAIPTLLDAIAKTAPSPNHVSPMHAELCKCCLLSRCYNAAIPVLSEPITEVDPATTAITPQDLLLYCYYGGMVHIGRKEYAQALQLFLNALTAPTMVVSAITMAIFKKFMLVSLIHQGQPGSLPRYASSSLTRAIKHEATFYIKFGDAYNNKPAQDLETMLTQQRDALTQAGDWGLAKLALETKTMRTIQKLTQTFLTLSLADIAQQAGLANAAEAESMILKMIANGDIHARIDESASMVRFLEDPEQYDTAEVLSRLDDCIQRSVKLSHKLQAVNDEVAADPEYLKRVSASKDRLGPFEDAPELGDGEPQSVSYHFP